jgi:hypothetical protein
VSAAGRVREGRKGSDEEVGAAVVGVDGPAADVGSSKSNVSGFGAGAGCSLISRKKKDRHEDRTHDGEALTMRLLILPSQHRLTVNFATGCELREKGGDLWTVLKVLRVLCDQHSLARHHR